MAKENIYENLREHVRQDVTIPVSIKLISPEEMKISEPKAFGRFSYYEPERTSASLDLSEKLNRIEQKIDSILDMFLLQQQGFFQLPEQNINLSGGGLSFISSVPFNKGDSLEIKMLLPEPSVVGITVYGEVVRVEQKDRGYEIGIKFTKINERQRDLIVRFVIYKERERIKRQKGLQ